MEHDVALTRKMVLQSIFAFTVGPHPTRDIVTLPIDGRLIKARIGEIHGGASSRAEIVQSVDHIDAAELERSNRQRPRRIGR